MEEDKKKPELKTNTIVFMVAVAIFYDVLQWFLAFVFLGWAVIPIAYGTFAIWFRMHGVKFFTSKRIGSLGVGAFLEFISAGIIPSITFNVLVVALDNKAKKLVPGSDIIKR